MWKLCYTSRPNEGPPTINGADVLTIMWNWMNNCSWWIPTFGRAQHGLFSVLPPCQQHWCIHQWFFVVVVVVFFAKTMFVMDIYNRLCFNHPIFLDWRYVGKTPNIFSAHWLLHSSLVIILSVHTVIPRAHWNGTAVVLLKFEPPFRKFAAQPMTRMSWRCHFRFRVGTAAECINEPGFPQVSATIGAFVYSHWPDEGINIGWSHLLESHDTPWFELCNRVDCGSNWRMALLG